MKTLLLILALAWPLLAEAKTNTPPVLEFRSAVECRPGRAKPEGTETMKMVHRAKSTSPGSEDVFFVSRAPLLGQAAVKSAKATTDSLGHPSIEINLTKQGRKQFAEITREHIGEHMAIVINGGLYSAPIIRSEIPGGKAVITGDFQLDEARELANKINKALK